MYFEHHNKHLEKPIDATSTKRLSKFLGTSHTLSIIRNLPPVELGKLLLHNLGNLRMGAFTLGLTLSMVAYYNYRKYYEQRYCTSSSFYKLMKTKQINAGDQFYQHQGVNVNTEAKWDFYYRMPNKEFDAIYRMRSAYINGYFDHNKEILFPEQKNGQEGYRVITPFYYFITPSVDYKHPKYQDHKITYNPIGLKAGMAVDRGW